MLDIQLLRKDIQSVAAKLASRGFELDVATFQEIEARRKDIQSRTQELQAQRNSLSKQVGILKGQGGDASAILAQVAGLGDHLKACESELGEIQHKLEELLLGIPNLPHESVPQGKSADDNREIRNFGEPKSFSFKTRDHVDIGAGLQGLDFEVAAKITGSRFAVMKGQLAQLHRAIAQFMLDTHAQEHGYVEVYVPYMVNADSMRGTGQLPKFEEDLFATFKAKDEKLYLIPTAEVPVTNLVREEIVAGASLPLKFVCHTPCFRSEAGSYGRDTRGMIRQHQFDKVELVQIVKPEHSYQCLEDLTGHAEAILKKLDLPYRVVTLCTGDMGFSAAKTYDIEVWLPGQSAYREISSCSNFESFQARRMQARYRDENDRPQLLHTINGSGLAVGRTLVAILENYQNEDGSVSIPLALRPYMRGAERISP